MMTAFSRRLSIEVPPLYTDGRSEWFLGIVRTPSSVHWEIVRYDKGYSKSLPWRSVTNGGVNVIVYYQLPNIREEAQGVPDRIPSS